MERNTLTSIENLKIGDRFYKALDKKKEVWEYISYSNKKYHCKRDNELHPTPFSGLMAVRFLRHATT